MHAWITFLSHTREASSCEHMMQRDVTGGKGTSQSREGGGWQVKDALPIGEQICHLLALLQTSFKILHCPQPLINLYCDRSSCFHELAMKLAGQHRLCVRSTSARSKDCMAYSKIQTGPLACYTRHQQVKMPDTASFECLVSLKWNSSTWCLP